MNCEICHMPLSVEYEHKCLGPLDDWPDTDKEYINELEMDRRGANLNFAELTRQLSEANILWADLGRKNNDLKEQLVAAKVYNERWIERCRDFRKQDADKAEIELAEARAEIARLRKDYMELIMAVHQKFSNETRHQTALRYIQDREAYVSEGKAQCHKALEASDERR